MTDPVDPEEPWRGLHPASVVVNLIPTLARTLRAAWPLVVMVVVSGSVQGAVNLGLLVAFFATGVARAVIHFLTLRYRVHDGRLEVVTGLLSRAHRTIDPARIQNVEIVQNLFQRAAGLVELRIEVAGDRAIDGLLSAITVEEAEALRAALARHAPAPATEDHDEVLRISLFELLGYGISAGRIGAAAVVVGLAFDALGQLSPESMQAAGSGLSGTAMVGLVLVSVAGAYLLSVGNAILRYFGFTLWETPSGIATQSGVFTRRRTELPRRKVQGVLVDEPWLRRLMGFATVHVDTAGSGLPPEAGGLPGEAVVPMVDADARLPLLRTVLPDLADDPWSVPLRPAARSALVRGLVDATLRWTLLAALAGIVLATPWTWLVLPWGWLAAWLDWQAQGWLLTPTHLVARRGFFRRQTWVVARAKVQSVHFVQGPLLRALGLARVIVWVAGDRIVFPDLTTGDADETFVGLGR